VSIQYQICDRPSPGLQVTDAPDAYCAITAQPEHGNDIFLAFYSLTEVRCEVYACVWHSICSSMAETGLSNTP
jgi:hypothetical protein